MPNATPGPNGFPSFSFWKGTSRPDLGMPNTNVQSILEAEKNGGPSRRRATASSKQEWIDACKGQSNGVTHGTSSKTHCDFDYSGSMMEQMLLGLVAHRAGKRIEYDPAAGRVTNSPEANDYLKRTYRSGWTLNG